MADYDARQAALAAIEGLTFADAANFFHQKASDRDKAIAGHLQGNDELECDYVITSEGDENGSWLLTWSWIDFAGTNLDKTKEPTGVQP